MKGIVVKSTGSWYRVETENKELIDCRLRGNFRLEDTGRTNPVAVGDIVEVEGTSGNYSIVSISDRRNYIIRKSNNLSKRTQIIAANVDLVLLMVTIKSPRTSLGFIDRYLAICELFGIDVLIFFNKCDILNSDEKNLLAEYKEIYSKIGYSIFQGSVHSGEGLDKLKEIINKKIVVLAGHSGVGKSSLLNEFFPAANQKTAQISDAHSKGVHTTTFAEMFISGDGMRIIDTPGIKDFGIVETHKSEIQNGFREIKGIRHLCKFNDCQHIDEPGCEILKRLNDISISNTRYYNYLAMRETLEEV